MRYLTTLAIISLLIVPPVARAQQISPNPNPAGNTITLDTAGAVNFTNVPFDNHGLIKITGGSILDIKSGGMLKIRRHADQQIRRHADQQIRRHADQRIRRHVHQQRHVGGGEENDQLRHTDQHLLVFGRRHADQQPLADR